jgi:hypothetical protein
MVACAMSTPTVSDRRLRLRMFVWLSGSQVAGQDPRTELHGWICRDNHIRYLRTEILGLSKASQESQSRPSSELSLPPESDWLLFSYVQVVSVISEAVSSLYSLGLRRFLLFGVSAIGCSPKYRGRQDAHGRGCDEKLDAAALGVSPK